MNFLRLAVVIILALGNASYVWAQEPAWKWYEVDAQGSVRVHLHLFWSQTCSHCPPAVAFGETLQRNHPWLQVSRYEISANPANRQLYQQMAANLNRVGGQTPAFFYCKQMNIGYVSYEQNGRKIEESLVRWHDALQEHYRKNPPASNVVGMLTLLLSGEDAPFDLPLPPELPVDLPPEKEVLYLPGWGDVDVGDMSLSAFTLVIAGCDAFNPCAFFVLLLLLSLLVHGQSRARMALVGGVFVAFSGIMYFLFMAAWLNLFFAIGHLAIITGTAGFIAVGVGLLNVKDFYWFKQGPSLSIPDSAKPSLFQRMTRLINVSSLPALLFGAAALAATANLYELLCTSGFPMVYTRVLTMHPLTPAEYYGYLFLYNVIYVAPMALIVIVFAWTLGARKLTEYGGRVLKLMSGIMMLSLGGILILWPTLLHSAVGAVALLAVAAGLTGLMVAVDCDRLDHPKKKR